MIPRASGRSAVFWLCTALTAVLCGLQVRRGEDGAALSGGAAAHEAVAAPAEPSGQPAADEEARHPYSCHHVLVDA